MRLAAVLMAGLCLVCARPAPRAADPTLVTITAIDYAFQGPDTIPAGLTTLRFINQGKELHHVSLVRLGGGKTVADFQAGLQAAMKNHTPPPAWIAFDGGPNASTPGDTATTTQLLEPGSYVLVCWIPSADGVPHIMKGMFRPLTVVPAAATGAMEPAADVVVRLTDYDFQFAQPLTAGRHTVRVESVGAQPHEIVVTALTPGKTLQDFVTWEQGGERGPLPTGRWLGGVTTLDAGKHAQFTATFAPGDYLVLCFWPDVKDGKPHLMHGMGKQIRIS
ncbi:MAG TPA: hypothetical protein VM716_12300 [Gemmatimonadales bacterium]|nr:hypothetical protein [Gemmatimonadales bacterium]